ncbi:MAG TPA: DUF599 domain-containing protein [Caulobacteraceae bacterium]|jgi:uncharacterized membrane protein|nr:DUF599 domain-containing protein [Caulobacteraceae bacterium]
MQQLYLVAARPFDLGALALFLVAWVAYEPILRALARGQQLINADMVTVRRSWMGQMMQRPSFRLLDSQLVSHTLSTASFFASSNLILIAAAAGALFGGENAYRKLETSPLLVHAPPQLFGLKLALVAVCLARGLLAFIWSIRQLNYGVAVIGAAPLEGPPPLMKAYAEAASAVLNPALHAFNAGVRSYYFALAATAWLAGPVPFAATTVGAVLLLAWRQTFSPAAKAVRRVRLLLETPGWTGEEG